MPSKEDEFKQRLAAVLADLKDGAKDEEVVRILGGVAAEIVDNSGGGTWSAFKRRLDAKTYDALLADIQAHGNRLVSEGPDLSAYVLQAIGTSLVAGTQRDPVVRAGDRLLDEFIDRAIAAHRGTQTPDRTIN